MSINTSLITQGKNCLLLQWRVSKIRNRNNKMPHNFWRTCGDSLTSNYSLCKWTHVYTIWIHTHHTHTHTHTPTPSGETVCLAKFPLNVMLNIIKGVTRTFSRALALIIALSLTSVLPTLAQQVSSFFTFLPLTWFYYLDTCFL